MPARILSTLWLLASSVLLSSCAFNHHVPMTRDDFGLNFVPVQVNGHSGVFLVDSGASHTVLDHRFAKRCLTNLTSSNLRLAWLGSKDNDTKEGVLSNIQIGNYFRNGPYRAHVLNLDAINHAPARLRTLRMDGILGADFFIAHGAMIDYRDDSLKFNAAPDGWMEPPRISVR
ncbi:MAG: retropepsin-like aspartic protease [Verrucomicrobiales bacterium]|jgi:hypothetical protein